MYDMKIKGNDIIVLFQIGERWETLALGLSCEVDISAETITVSNPLSGRWPKRKKKRLSWTGSSAHLMTEKENAVNAQEMIKSSLPVKVMIGSVEAHPSPNEGVYWPDGRFSMQGDAFVTRLTITASKGTLANMSIEFEGSGEPTFGLSIPDGVFDRTFDHTFE